MMTCDQLSSTTVPKEPQPAQWSLACLEMAVKILEEVPVQRSWKFSMHCVFAYCCDHGAYFQCIELCSTKLPDPFPKLLITDLYQLNGGGVLLGRAFSVAAPQWWNSLPREFFWEAGAISAIISLLCKGICILALSEHLYSNPDISWKGSYLLLLW